MTRFTTPGAVLELTYKPAYGGPLIDAAAACGGNETQANRQSAGVDPHHGAEQPTTFTRNVLVHTGTYGTGSSVTRRYTPVAPAALLTSGATYR